MAPPGDCSSDGPTHRMEIQIERLSAPLSRIDDASAVQREHGYLQPGVHFCTLEELVARFGSGSPERDVDMTPALTDAGYLQTKVKLSDLIERRSRVLDRMDLSPTHRAEVLRSYNRMIRQYRREIKLYEAARAPASAPTTEAAEK